MTADKNKIERYLQPDVRWEPKGFAGKAADLFAAPAKDVDLGCGTTTTRALDEASAGAVKQKVAEIIKTITGSHEGPAGGTEPT